MGASCELWYYPRQPTGAGIPGAREVGTEYRNSRRQPRSLQDQNWGSSRRRRRGDCGATDCEGTGVYETAPGRLGQASENGGSTATRRAGHEFETVD